MKDKLSNLSPEPFKVSDGLIARELWDNADWGLAFIAKDGTWIRANPTLCNMLEYTESELKDRTFQSITHPDDLHADLDMLNAILDGVVSGYVMYKRYITKTGKVIFVRLKVSSVSDSNEDFVFFLSQMSPPIDTDVETALIETAVNHALEAREADLPSVFKTHWKKILSGIVIVMPFVLKSIFDVIVWLVRFYDKFVAVS